MRLLMISFAMLAVAGISQFTKADTPAKKRSAELQVLDRFVGTWDFDVTNTLPGGDKITGKTSETRSWSLGDRFVRFENPKPENSEEPEFQMLVTYDPATKSYPGFLMSGPSRSLVDGTWDPASQTMTFRGKSIDGGITFIYTNRFVDQDHWDVAGVIKDAAGKVVVEQTQKQTRRKK